MSREFVEAVQRHYPRIYSACHVDHIRAKSTAFRLSAQDSTLLIHLDRKEAISAGELARHLGVSASTLSAAIKRLEALGYLSRSKRAGNRRQIELRMTELGAKAMAATSVLDGQRLASVSGFLTSQERRRAVEGMALLARACDRLQVATPRRRQHL